MHAIGLPEWLLESSRDMEPIVLPRNLMLLWRPVRLRELAGAAATQSAELAFYEDAEIFARNLHAQGNIDERDWEVYQRLYQGIRRALRPPDVLIALTCSLGTTKKRITRRGRAMEQEIPDAYLRRLHKLYTRWFDTYDLSPIVRIDTTKLDYVEDLVDLIDLIRILDDALA
jgi:deoxyadenosine/deoxycytidine kinase